MKREIDYGPKAEQLTPERLLEQLLAMLHAFHSYAGATINEDQFFLGMNRQCIEILNGMRLFCIRHGWHDGRPSMWVYLQSSDHELERSRDDHIRLSPIDDKVAMKELDDILNYFVRDLRMQRAHEMLFGPVEVQTRKQTRKRKVAAAEEETR